MCVGGTVESRRNAHRHGDRVLEDAGKLDAGEVVIAEYLEARSLQGASTESDHLRRAGRNHDGGESWPAMMSGVTLGPDGTHGVGTLEVLGHASRHPFSVDNSIPLVAERNT